MGRKSFWNKPKQRIACASLVFSLLGLSTVYWRAGQADEAATKTTPSGKPAAAAEDPAIERTRKQILMLDDLYKTAVVLITDKYVQKDTDISAGTAAQALFDAMRKKGHHDVRLLDATGTPYDDDNIPKDAFEKKAIEQLRGGQKTVEQVESRQGGRVLRLATPIPMVMTKCTLCHENYKGKGASDVIGALSYTLKID